MLAEGGVKIHKFTFVSLESSIFKGYDYGFIKLATFTISIWRLSTWILGINLIAFINLEEDELKKKKKKNFLNIF